MAGDDRSHASASVYRVVVRGRLPDLFAASFDGMTIEPGEDASVLTGPVRDQCHLMGILAAVNALGLEFVSAYPTVRRGSVM